MNIVSELFKYLCGNYIQVIISVISGFMGFGSALLVERISANTTSKKYKKELLKRLKNELVGVKCTLEELHPQQNYIDPFSIPIWKGAKASGGLLDLNSDPAFEEMVQIFSEIEDANMVEKECFKLMFSNGDAECKKRVYEVMSQTRVSLKNRINDVLKE